MSLFSQALEQALARESFRQRFVAMLKDTTLMEEVKASISTVEFLQREMLKTPDYPTKQALLDAALTAASIEKSDLVLEFGVWRGDSIRHIGTTVQARVFGFDSFEGLPERWRPGYPAGFFALPELPQVPANVTLVKGWFNTTLPSFLAEQSGEISFIHIDCDLYTSTKEIFDLCNHRISRNAVIVFDEYFNHARWESGEYLAFKEWIAKTGRAFDYLGYCATNEQVAVRLK